MPKPTGLYSPLVVYIQVRDMLYSLPCSDSCQGCLFLVSVCLMILYVLISHMLLPLVAEQPVSPSSVPLPSAPPPSKDNKKEVTADYMRLGQNGCITSTLYDILNFSAVSFF